MATTENRFADRQKLFEFILIHHPPQSKEQFERGEMPESTFIFGEETKRILAWDMEEAQVIAGRAIPDEYIKKLREVQVIIRPF